MSGADTQQARSLVETWVDPGVRELSAYHVAPASGMLKLDAMESPFGLDDDTRRGWLEALAEAEINRYPDPSSTGLKSRLTEVLDIPAGAGLVLGNGSDELIQLLAILLGGPGRTFLSPVPSFSMYAQIARATATDFRGVPLNSDFRLDTGVLLAAIEETQPACVFLAWPNNPTGNCFGRDQVNAVLAAAPGVVVVDEAYFAFCGDSYLAEVPRQGNLVVLRTLSKSGLAGLRLGMLLAQSPWTDELEKLRLPYNINVLTQASAEFLLRDYGRIEQQSNTITGNRERLFTQLDRLPGVQAFPSRTNFILVRLADAHGVYRRMAEAGVLVRKFGEAGLEDCLRITVSTEADNARMLEVLESSLA